jgi:hypothetical protein
MVSNKFNTMIPNARYASVGSTRLWRSFLVFYTSPPRTDQ